MQLISILLPISLGDQLERLSRDNLSSPPFALVTYITSIYKIRPDIKGKITGNICHNDLQIV